MIVASTISVRLCGGILVAMPTAIPSDPLTSKFGITRRQNRRLRFRAVVVRIKIDRFFVEVFEQRGRDARQPSFGITIGRGRIAIDRAKVALPIDQRSAHGKRLRQSHQRVIHREVAVRMVLAHHFSDDTGALARGAVRERGPSAAWCKECGDAPASIRRERRAARGQ